MAGVAQAQTWAADPANCAAILDGGAPPDFASLSPRGIETRTAGCQWEVTPQVFTPGRSDRIGAICFDGFASSRVRFRIAVSADGRIDLSHRGPPEIPSVFYPCLD